MYFLGLAFSIIILSFYLGFSLARDNQREQRSFFYDPGRKARLREKKSNTQQQTCNMGDAICMTLTFFSAPLAPYQRDFNQLSAIFFNEEIFRLKN